MNWLESSNAAKLAILIAAAASLGASCSAQSDPLSRDGSEDGQDRLTCAAGATVEGVDVSYYQSNIDWNQVKASGRAFAFIRVSDGSFIDPKFATNWSSAKAAGVIRGAYQFYRAHEDGAGQANLLLQHMGALEPGDLPPTLDVEVTDGQSDSKIVAGIQSWVSTIQSATGKTPIVYVSPGFWAGISNAQSDGTTLWVANWGVSCPSMPSSWSAWKFWQYSDSGSAPGISGAVDLDRFNGSLADLQAFADGGSAPAACDAQQCNAHCMNQLGCGACQSNQCVCQDASVCGNDPSGSGGGNSGSGGFGGSGGGSGGFSSSGGFGGSGGFSSSGGFGGSSSSWSSTSSTSF